MVSAVYAIALPSLIVAGNWTASLSPVCTAVSPYAEGAIIKATPRNNAVMKENFLILATSCLETSIYGI